MKVEHLIQRDFITVNPYLGIIAIKKQLIDYSAVVVQDENQFYGVLTPKDIVQNAKTLIIDCITDKTVIDCECTVEQALIIMNDSKTDVLPVRKDEKIIGLVFKNNLYNYIAEYNIQLEVDIKKRILELEKAVTMKDMLFSVIAHDLKCPFNAILGFSQLLKDNVRKNKIEDTEEHINIIHKQAQKTFDLLNHLLTWAQTQIGQTNFNPIKFDFSQSCKEVIDVLEEYAHEKNITIRCNLPDKFEIYGDKDMIETIVRNLISNAIKFTEKDGTIEIYSRLQDVFIEIIIADNGIGISENDKQKLFNYDYNNSQLGTDQEKGTGLGLIICKEFIKKHGGKIWIEDNPEKGSEFKFTLPLSPEKYN
jgi:signal transduction histidine kinase